MKPTDRRQFLESIVKREISADDMQRLENMAGSNLAAFADIAERANVNRRDFLKYSGLTALMAGIAVASNNCAGGAMGLSNIKETGPVHYPKLPGHKIQSPEHYGLEGCMTGEWPGWNPIRSASDHIQNYEEKSGKPPSILVIQYFGSRIPHHFAVIDRMTEAAEKGVIPLVTYDGRYTGQETRNNLLNEIIDGKHDETIKNTANQLRDFGEQYGGFFIRTMREMNMDHWPWGGNTKKFKKTWKYIWDIFDGEGANDYATWVFTVQANTDRLRFGCGAEQYYPDDDKYVDWIGLNGFSSSRVGNASFARIFGSTYSKMRKNHPSKPIMINETGRDGSWNKAKWTEDAFNSVKEYFLGIKALCWWDENWSGTWNGLDTRIDSSPEALKAFRKAIADPYFLGKVPYREDLKNKI